MSSSDSDTESDFVEEKKVRVLKEPSEIRRGLKVERDALNETATVKKRRITGNGKVGKPTVIHRSSRPIAQNEGRRIESRSGGTPMAQNQRRDADSFYRGALVGSFLGATLTTIVTNLVTRTLGGS